MIVVGVILVILGLWYFLGSGSNPITISPSSSPSSYALGRVVFAVKDAALDMKNVTSVFLTVDKVEAHSAATGEWVTVLSTARQYDLLKLKQTGAAELLADVKLAAGTYDQIRLDVSRVSVVASGKTQDAKLPSSTLKIVGNVVVKTDQTAVVTIDFIADKSLHLTGSGKYMLAPVVRLEAKSGATVDVGSDEKVTVSGGKVDDDETVGMDEKGEVKAGFEIDANAKIEIDSNDVIHIIGKKEGEDKTKAKDQSGEGVKLNLSSQNNSGIAGTATLNDIDGKVKVTLKLNAVPTGITGVIGSVGISVGAAHPAHIHQGSCAALGAVKYPLASTVDGKSETTINASLANLKAQLPLAINVHKSSEEIGVYVACADIKL